MNFNVNYKDVAKQIIPYFLRTVSILRFLYASIKPLRELNQTFYGDNKFTDYGTYQYWRYLLWFTGQTIYLERMLNDQYDPTDRRIYIENTASGNFYLFNNEEAVTPVYMYNNYNAANTYAADEYSIYNSTLYKSLQAANTGNQPDITPLWWESQGSMSFVFNNGETTSQYDFIIWIPISIKFAAGFPNYSTLRSRVDALKIAPKRYKVNTF